MTGTGPTRRGLLLAGALATSGLARPGDALALPARPLVFPRDHGSHPELRTEWWYITGHLQPEGAPATSTARPPAFGFQITFFRSRVDETQTLRSALAARQLVFAHAAITDLATGRLLHDQRISRAGAGMAHALTHNTDIRLRDWTLRRLADGHYDSHIPAREFALSLRCTPTQPLLLQGQRGLSRKGPEPAQASYYYSQPQLSVSGEIRLPAQRLRVSGKGWLDHEFSEALLHPDAVGWDWIGMNLLDGAALTAFRLRTRDHGTLWAGGSWRSANGALTIFPADAVRFTPRRYWDSPSGGTRYPVSWSVETPAGTYTVDALLDQQELDSRTSTGTVYWEGLSRLMDARQRVAGYGYLEMTGYAQPLRL